MKRLGNASKPKVAKAGWKAKIKSKSSTESASASDTMQTDRQSVGDSTNAMNILTGLSDQLMGLGNFGRDGCLACCAHII